ncbi:MAG: hypothetical protein RIQ77_564 [Pseudomonadota bacterium]
MLFREGSVVDNKYGLGSSKVANEINKKHKDTACKFCDHKQLRFCPTMEDHQCEKCNRWQNDLPDNYATGRSSDY